MKTSLLAIKDSALLEVISFLLQQNGYSTICSGTSADARRLMRQHSLDLLVVSWNIDTEGAPPLIAEARKKNPKLPVVTLAGSYSQNEWRELIPALEAVPVQTGGIREFMPSVNKATALMSRHTLRLLWDTEGIAETVYQGLAPTEGKEPLERDAFLEQFMKRRKTAVEALADDFGVRQFDVFGLVPGTLLLAGKGRDELIELWFWLDCQIATMGRP